MDEQKEWERLSQSLIRVMMQAFFEELVSRWTKELRTVYRDRICALTEFIRKRVEIIACLHPGIELYNCEGDEPEVGIVATAKDTMVFIFRRNVCIEAFRIPNELLPEVMSEELTEDFRRLFYLMGREFKGVPTWKKLPTDDRFKLN